MARGQVSGTIILSFGEEKRNRMIKNEIKSPHLFLQMKSHLDTSPSESPLSAPHVPAARRLGSKPSTTTRLRR